MQRLALQIHPLSSLLEGVTDFPVENSGRILRKFGGEVSRSIAEVILEGIQSILLERSLEKLLKHFSEKCRKMIMRNLRYSRLTVSEASINFAPVPIPLYEGKGKIVTLEHFLIKKGTLRNLTLKIKTFQRLALK